MFLYASDMMKYAFSESLCDDYVEGSHCIMGVAFDSTTSYRAGSRYGPKAIREASYNFESYNINFDTTLTATSYDIGDVEINNGNYDSTKHRIKDTVKTVLEMNLKPIVLGGEHTVSHAVVEAIKEHDEDSFREATIVHFDAHLDMRDTYLGEKYSHATVLRRIHELNPRQIIQIGIRSAQRDEYDYVKCQDNITVYTNRDVKESKYEIIEKLSAIDNPVYITVDVDVLDPAYAPSVGTPSPCGITPLDLEDFIKHLAVKDVLGLDVVEVSSDRIGDITSINASKVIYDYLCLQEQ